jgi:hypothetical protein
VGAVWLELTGWPTSFAFAVFNLAARKRSALNFVGGELASFGRGCGQVGWG